MENTVKMMITVDKTETGRPIAKISFKNEGATSRFLRDDLVITAFRDYCFQITDLMGCTDYGSTRSISFDTFKDLPAVAKAEILRCMAATVLYEYAATHKCTIAFNTVECWGHEVFREFIKATFEYLYPDDKWPFID